MSLDKFHKSTGFWKTDVFLNIEIEYSQKLIKIFKESNKNVVSRFTKILPFKIIVLIDQVIINTHIIQFQLCSRKPY